MQMFTFQKDTKNKGVIYGFRIRQNIYSLPIGFETDVSAQIVGTNIKFN